MYGLRKSSNSKNWIFQTSEEILKIREKKTIRIWKKSKRRVTSITTMKIHK